MSRDRIGAAAVVVLEVLLYVQYTRLDGEFHYWLHGLIGGAVGLGASTAARLRGRRGLTGWEAGVLGHLYSAAPDILFLTADLPHARWMDVFAFHVGAHFVSAPVLTALALFLLALAGYALVTSRRAGPARAAAAPLAAAVVIAAVAVATAAPVPTDVEDLRADPRLAWHHPPHRVPFPPGGPAGADSPVARVDPVPGARS
jgi:cbb3-type cytochrome oxidase subunit 3